MKGQPNKKKSTSGESLIEFALILPLLFLLIVNVVNFGGMMYAWIAVSNAARTGADYMTRGGATIGSPSLPAASAVSAVVTADLHALPNNTSTQVCVCTNNNGTVSCTGTPCGTTPADPEASFYVSGTVDVTYTYQPFIALWSIPGLNIQATLPATKIHRQAVTRLLQ